MLAALLTALVWQVFDVRRTLGAPDPVARPAAAPAAPQDWAGAGELGLLTLAYGSRGATCCKRRRGREPRVSRQAACCSDCLSPPSAAGLLVFGAVLYLAIARRHPAARP